MNVLPAVPFINRGRCSGCGRCVAACPEHLITLEVSGYRKFAVWSGPEYCSRCGACISNCLTDAMKPQE